MSALVGCSSGGGGGAAGTTGSAGTTGAAGSTAGTTGGAGTTGAAGATAGTTGAAGTTATAGTTGAAGAAAGTTGSAGTTGAAGAAAGAGGAAAGTTGAAGAGGIEAIDLTTPGPSTGCGKAPDLTGDKLPYNGMTFYKKAVSFPGKGGATVMGEYLIALPANYAMATPSKLGFEMGGYTRDAIDCIYGDCFGFATEGHKANAIVVAMTQINPGALHPGQTGATNLVTTGWELSNELENNVAFFKAVKADILDKYCVDTKHVFVAGGSSGGDMAHYLGCWLGNELRGVASVGGCMANTIAPVAGKAATMPNMPTVYYPAAARGQESAANICLHTMDFSVCPGNVAVLMVHGFEDPHIPTAEARLTRDAWAVKNGCAATATPSLDSIHTMITAGTTPIVPGSSPPFPVNKAPNKISCGNADACATNYPVRWCEHSEPGYDNSTHGWPSTNTEPDGAGTDIWTFWTSLK